MSTVTKYARKVKKKNLVKMEKTSRENGNQHKMKSRRKRNKHVHTETNGSTSIYTDTFNFTALHSSPPHDGAREVATLHRRSA
jgi:hypothetical protein